MLFQVSNTLHLLTMTPQRISDELATQAQVNANEPEAQYDDDSDISSDAPRFHHPSRREDDQLSHYSYQQYSIQPGGSTSNNLYVFNLVRPTDRY